MLYWFGLNNSWLDTCDKNKNSFNIKLINQT
jgi:hypothetical protein